MYFDINKYIINMVPELKRTKNTTQYKLLNSLMKGYEEIRGTLNLMENMEIGIYPFIEPDFYYNVSTSLSLVAITEDIETHLNNNYFVPTSLVLSEQITLVKSLKIPQFVLDKLFLLIRKQNKSKYFSISNNKITNFQNGEDLLFVLNNEIIDYNKVGNIFYCLESDRLELFDLLNGDLLFSTVHLITDIKGFLLIPNGIIVKHNDDTYDNYNFLFEYDFEYEGSYYSLNLTNLNITSYNSVYTFQDHMLGHIPFSRTNLTIQLKLILNIVYSNIMQLDNVSEIYTNANLNPLFDQYTDIGYKEKIKIINTILQNTTTC